MIVLGASAFEVVPRDRLSEAERTALDRLSSIGPAADPAGPVFELELLEGMPRVPQVSGDDDSPAAVDWAEGRVRIRHRRLDAALDASGGRGWLRRDVSVGWPLEVTLRTALAARLPLAGGLPLHAAGLVIGGRGVAFFGPSGAGKSTLASISPYPVLSDEMVAVVRRADETGHRRCALGGTGFWGTLGQNTPPAGLFPLAALVELAHAPRLRVQRLDPRTAMRRLIASVLVPPGPPLWSAALSSISTIVREVPVLRLAWAPAEPPWPALDRALGRRSAVARQV
jgi:hypothetical protein